MRNEQNLGTQLSMNNFPFSFGSNINVKMDCEAFIGFAINVAPWERKNREKTGGGGGGKIFLRRGIIGEGWAPVI